MSSFIKKLDIQAILNQCAFIVKKLDLKTHLSDNKKVPRIMWELFKKSSEFRDNIKKSRQDFVIMEKYYV